VDNFFYYKNSLLFCESVSLLELAKKFGTPLFVTSKQSLLEQYQRFEKAFAALNHLTCYSVKANYNLSVIRTLVDAGSGLDVNSEGELYRALNAGASPQKIIMAGVGKTEAEIEYALRQKILMIKAESLSELKLIEKVARRLKIQASVGIRVTPNITAETHPYISTGNADEKFGIDERLMEKTFLAVKKMKFITVSGLEMHIGSKISNPKYYYDATLKLLEVKALAEKLGIEITHFDIGGGFPVPYHIGEQETPIEEFAKMLVPLLKNIDAKILFEPGRFMVANASVIVSKTLYIKQNENGKKFVIVDAAMNDLIRPALYGSYHEILPIKKKAGKITADIVGPVCESGDFFARAREIGSVQEGDYVAVMSAGAYGYVMSSNYNARPRAAEVMVSGKTVRLARKRETLEQMLQNER